MNLFNNPYSGQQDVKRITTDVSSGDYFLVKSTRPGLATITATMGTLWQKLCYELRKRNITDFTHIAEFEKFVANCRITDEPAGDGGRLPDGTVSRSDAVASPPNVGGGTPQQSPSNTSTPPVLPNIQSGRRRKVKGT